MGRACHAGVRKQEAREAIPGKQQIQSESPFICRAQSASGFICLYLAPIALQRALWKKDVINVRYLDNKHRNNNRYPRSLNRKRALPVFITKWSGSISKDNENPGQRKLRTFLCIAIE